MNTHIFSPAAIEAALALSTYSPKSGRNTAAGSSAPATDSGKGIKLLNVSYDAARDFYEEYNPLLAKEYQVEHNGGTVDIQQSHGGSSKQAPSVVNGLVADVATMNQTSSIELLEQKGLIKPDWTKCLPDNTVPYASTATFLVHEGNPKQIEDQPDLTKNGVQVVIVNPKTIGNGRYAFLGAYDYGLKANNGDESKAKKFAATLLKNAPVFENGDRATTTTFSQRNTGDVLIIFENGADHVSKKLTPNQLEVVYPSYTILSESPVAAVDGVVGKKSTRTTTEEYLQYPRSKPAQEPAAKLYLCSRDAEILATHEANFPEIGTFSPNEKFSPWEGIMEKYSSDDGLVNQPSPKKQRPASVKGRLKG